MYVIMAFECRAPLHPPPDSESIRKDMDAAQVQRIFTISHIMGNVMGGGTLDGLLIFFSNSLIRGRARWDMSK